MHAGLKSKHGEVIEEDVVDSSTWLKVDGKWKCAAHTETKATH